MAAVYSLIPTPGVSGDVTGAPVRIHLSTPGATFFPFVLDLKPSGGDGGGGVCTIQGRVDDGGQWADLFSYTFTNGANRMPAPTAVPLMPQLRAVITGTVSPGPVEAFAVVPHQT